MKPILLAAVCAGYSAVITAQPAEIEFEGVFGECSPVWAAVADRLELYREPDLRAEAITIPFREGWRIEAPRGEGLTRVLTIGVLRVTEPDDRMYCRVEPTDGPNELLAGELVEYLYNRGEGFGAIRFRGAECEAQTYEDLGHFEVVEIPDVQVWLRVFYADGTSPGWLLHDGSQTRVADVLC